MLTGIWADTVLNSWSSSRRGGDMLRAASKSKGFMSFLLIDTVRSSLQIPLQDPSKVLRLFQPSTEEKHRNNLALASYFPKNSKESQGCNIAFDFLQVQQFTQLIALFF